MADPNAQVVIDAAKALILAASKYAKAAGANADPLDQVSTDVVSLGDLAAVLTDANVDAVIAKLDAAERPALIVEAALQAVATLLPMLRAIARI